MSMFSGNIFSYAQNKASGASFTLFNLSFPGSPPADAKKPTELIIPWRELQEDSGENPLALLEWQSRCSSFAGRETELQTLRKWADSKPKVSVKFVCGHGGVGKSRLAAEFADSLDTEGWRAGFVNLRQSAAYKGGSDGTLMVIDYPEENRDVVVALLRDLANAGLKCRLRLLLLTRSTIKEWEDIISDTRSRGIVNWHPVKLEKLPVEDAAAYTIYASTLENVAENKETTPPPLATAVLKEWMKRQGEHALPLFLVAAAVYSALHPDEQEVRFTGPEVMTALVEREGTRLRGMAEGLGLPLDSLPLALTYATLCKGALLEDMEEDANLCKLLGLKKGTPWQDVLIKSGHAANGTLRNLEPDIVGADFVHATLARNKKTAPELVWRAAARNPEAAIGTFGRLIYDAQDTLGRDKPHLQHGLELALEADEARCAALKAWANIPLPYFLAKCAECICLHLSNSTADAGEKAQLLGNLGSQRVLQGRYLEAIMPLQDAVDMHRRLARQNPVRFDPDLSVSLNNLSNSLSGSGQYREALKVMQEVVSLDRKMAAQNPTRFEPGLAVSLNNLSAILDTLGQHSESLGAIREAVDIRRRLAAQEPARFESDLAVSLHNLSNSLSAFGQHREALGAIQEAVGIRRRLAAQEPAHFEPGLADSLSNLSNRLYALGQHREALEASKETVRIHKRMAEQEPARFEAVLAGSLNNLSVFLSALGQHREALEVSKMSVGIYKRLAAREPVRFEPDLAMSQSTLAGELSALGQRLEAIAAIQEAVTIRRKLAVQEQAAFEPSLAMSLGAMTRILNVDGQHEKALEAIEEAATLFDKHAAHNFLGVGRYLVMSLRDKADTLTTLNRPSEAVTALAEADEIERRLEEAQKAEAPQE
jgi:tetratricopeptide (TPR) repeat protein